jgi:hypothetical protein
MAETTLPREVTRGAKWDRCIEKFITHTLCGSAIGLVSFLFFRACRVLLSEVILTCFFLSHQKSGFIVHSFWVQQQGLEQALLWDIVVLI